MKKKTVFPEQGPTENQKLFVEQLETYSRTFLGQNNHNVKKMVWVKMGPKKGQHPFLNGLKLEKS